MPYPNWGLRADKTSKGPGYFGTLDRPEGGVSTELSIGVNLEGEETEIPSLVPSLSKKEIDYLLSGKKPTEEIAQKAIAHARKRIKYGKNPFAEKGEQTGVPKMPYPMTYGRRAFGYQVEEMTPEEQAGVPMLTNIPKTAEAAAERGQDIYFLSDRPETEEFLAEKTPARPYKKVLRDVRATRPSEEDLTGMEAWKEFKEGYLSKQAGFYDPDEINPPAQGQKARQDYIESFFRGKTRQEIDVIDPGMVNKIYKEADRLAKAEETKATWTRRNALEIKTKFLADWKERRKEIEAAGKEAEKAAAAKEKEPLVPVQEGEEVVYRRRGEAVGKRAPIRRLIPTVDEAGNITYTPAEQAVGKAPPPKGKEKTPEEKEKIDREKAIKMAQREPDWAYGSEEIKNWMIEKNLALLQDREPPDPPEEVLEYRELPKGTKIDVKNKEHMAVLKRIRREAEGESGGDMQKARKIFNQKIEKKGWISPMGIGLKVK